MKIQPGVDLIPHRELPHGTRERYKQICGILKNDPHTTNSQLTKILGDVRSYKLYTVAREAVLGSNVDSKRRYRTKLYKEERDWITQNADFLQEKHGITIADIYYYFLGGSNHKGTFSCMIRWRYNKAFKTSDANDKFNTWSHIEAICQELINTNDSLHAIAKRNDWDHNALYRLIVNAKFGAIRPMKPMPKLAQLREIHEILGKTQLLNWILSLGEKTVNFDICAVVDAYTDVLSTAEQQKIADVLEEKKRALRASCRNLYPDIAHRRRWKYCCVD